MADVLKLIWWAIIGLFRSRASLEAEILTLRHQLNVLRRKSPKRPTFSNFDRLVFATLYRFAPHVVNALAIVRAGDRHPLASCRFSFVLAMEVEVSRRQTKGPARNSPTDPRHEPGQPALGRSQDPWRTSQARHRRWPNLGRQIHGKAQKAAIPRLEDVPAQPCRWNRIDRSVCCSDDLIPAAIWPVDSTARPTPNPMAGSDRAPDGRMDRPATYRGLRLGPRYRDTSSAIATASMASFSNGGFAPWAFVTGQPRRDLHGRMDTPNG